MSSDIGSKTLREKIYNEILNNILCRKYPENSFLIERKIAEELFVSRTPIREAFKMLEKEGWIRYIPNKGMKVTILSEQEVDDIFQVRKPLESIVVVNACDCIDWDGLQQLKDCVEKEAVAMHNKDWNTFMDTDLTFHNILLYKQRNLVVRKFLSELRAKSKLYGIRILYGDKGRLQLTVDEHYAIYHAVLVRKPDEAQKCMETHIQSVYDAARDYLATIPKYPYDLV